MKTGPILVLLFLLCCEQLSAQQAPTHTLSSTQLPRRWDESFPMGNGLLGAMLWQKNDALRLSLDRADLWDLRPMKGLDRLEFSYSWVTGQVAKQEYAVVQQYFDAPYEQEAGPSKLPGAALEWPLGKYNQVAAKLDLATGLTTVTFDNGLVFKTFVDANQKAGWFRLEGKPGQGPVLKTPAYGGDPLVPAGGSVAGDDLSRLGYTPTIPQQMGNTWVYHQPCYAGFSYEVAVGWKQLKDGAIEGVWSISAHFKEKPDVERASSLIKRLLKKGFYASYKKSAAWWSDYWAQSSIEIPDPVLSRQYALDMYKFGCVARKNAPMVSLQAIWTADNGRLPPWKGDLHHDLNTELSYWPAYTSNHTEEGMSYIQHIESNEAAHRRFTKQYFGNEGINIPGVETLLGEPMGGWIQYACSPTTGAWIAQHFYKQWRYTMDRTFLKKRAWPFIQAVAQHLEAITYLNDAGVRVLPLSSSPEIHDNSLQAWFPDQWTNYDLALGRYLFGIAAELAFEQGFATESARWLKRLQELPGFVQEESGELMFATGLPYRESHRHFSHLMAIHPMGLIDWQHGPEAQAVIKACLAQLEKYGPDSWTGYSYAWQANLYARAHAGEQAREALYRFADGFVSQNSFHLNGDQSGKGYSGFTYRPFTLEGNFASAAGVLEMLLQSHSAVIEIFPAVPASWQDISFYQLRAEGAFLISAVKKSGQVKSLRIQSLKGGTVQVYMPWVKADQLDPAWQPVPGRPNVWMRDTKEKEVVEIRF
jgi:alpha-L-fucosidase 2